MLVLHMNTPEFQGELCMHECRQILQLGQFFMALDVLAGLTCLAFTGSIRTLSLSLRMG